VGNHPLMHILEELFQDLKFIIQSSISNIETLDIVSTKRLKDLCRD